MYKGTFFNSIFRRADSILHICGAVLCRTMVLFGLAAYSGGIRIYAQTDSVYLTVEQLYRLGIENNLRLQADRIKE